MHNQNGCFCTFLYTRESTRRNLNSFVFPTAVKHQKTCYLFTSQSSVTSGDISLGCDSWTWAGDENEELFRCSQWILNVCDRQSAWLRFEQLVRFSYRLIFVCAAQKPNLRSCTFFCCPHHTHLSQLCTHLGNYAHIYDLINWSPLFNWRKANLDQFFPSKYYWSLPCFSN